MDNEMLTQIAKEYFSDYGSVSAVFEKHTDLKIRWARAGDKSFISLQVCDYLKNAPIEVVAALLRVVSARLRGDDTPYPDFVCEYLDSERFRVEGDACNLSLHMERMREYMPDLDYDSESEVNERIYDMLFDLEEKGYKVAPVTVGTTSKIDHPMGSGHPWLLSLLFKEVILQRDFIEKLDDEELEAVLTTCLDAIHAAFKDVTGNPFPDIVLKILDRLGDDDARRNLLDKLGGPDAF